MKEAYSKYNSKIGRFSFNDSSPLKNTHIRIAENSEGIKWVYFGEMQEGSKEIRQGRGVLVFEHGEICMVEWKQDALSGRGREIYKSGGWYEGTYESNKKNGKGTYYWKDGKKVIGQWKDGKRHGEAEFTDVDNKKYKEKYRDGELVKSELMW
jgi:hypothetical protein